MPVLNVVRSLVTLGKLSPTTMLAIGQPTSRQQDLIVVYLGLDDSKMGGVFKQFSTKIAVSELPDSATLLFGDEAEFRRNFKQPNRLDRGSD